MITRATWSSESDAGLAKALPCPVLRSIVADEVTRGVSNLWRCTTDQHQAWAVTRLDHNPDELVVVAFEGSGMLTFGPMFVRAAQAANVPLRAHVTSPLVERLLRRLKLTRSEVILRTRAA